VLIGSPIFQGEGGDFGGAGAAEGGAPYEFGVDPNMDPELALALRVSLEEERARQNVVEGAAGATAAGPSGASDSAGGAAAEAKGTKPGEGPAAAATTAAAAGAEGMELDEDALLQQALALSMQADQEKKLEGQSSAPPASSKQEPPQQQPQPPPSQPQPQPQQQPPSQGDASMFDNMEDEELQRALAMSMQDSEPNDKVCAALQVPAEQAV